MERRVLLLSGILVGFVTIIFVVLLGWLCNSVAPQYSATLSDGTTLKIIRITSGYRHSFTYGTISPQVRSICPAWMAKYLPPASGREEFSSSSPELVLWFHKTDLPHARRFQLSGEDEIEFSQKFEITPRIGSDYVPIRFDRVPTTSPTLTIGVLDWADTKKGEYSRTGEFRISNPCFSSMHSSQTQIRTSIIEDGFYITLKSLNARNCVRKHLYPNDLSESAELLFELHPNWRVVDVRFPNGPQSDVSSKVRDDRVFTHESATGTIRTTRYLGIPVFTGTWDIDVECVRLAGFNQEELQEPKNLRWPDTQHDISRIQLQKHNISLQKLYANVPWAYLKIDSNGDDYCTLAECKDQYGTVLRVKQPRDYNEYAVSGITDTAQALTLTFAIHRSRIVRLRAIPVVARF